ncbi:MAG: glycosyltransferase family 4 protein [Candidatus Harrisonbacteria bacterium]|nr:glycosyltransferase family 4 protein [Candidatus Harrisonbacteria bacterium]
MNIKKIAVILRRLNVRGGTQRQALSLARELQKRGHTIKLYTFLYDADRSYGDMLKNFEVVSLNKGTGPSWLKSVPLVRHFLQLVNENKLAKELAMMMDDDFDLLNPHDQVSYKVAFYYKKYKRNVPSVWHMNDLPLLCWAYDRLMGADEAFRQSLVKRFLYYIADQYEIRKFLRHQDAIIVVDSFNVDLVKKYMNLEAITVRSGPDTEHFTFTKRTPPSKNIKILTSGILMPHRRYQDTIRAVKMLLDEGCAPTLTILGDYENDKKYHQLLINLVNELGIQNNVKFLGRVSEKDLLRAYAEHDIYVFQHHLQSDGLSPFEAAVSGLPILVSRTAGCHEMLTDHENALIIEPKNPADIAGCVKELADNSDLYMKLSKNGAEFVCENFSWAKYADGVLRVFENAAKSYKE